MTESLLAFAIARLFQTVDAAIARVKSAKNATSAIRLIGVPQGVNRTVRRDMQVQKTGRTTDYTIGIVKDINYRTALTYSTYIGGLGAESGTESTVKL